MERLPYLDGVRGVAASIVYLHHFAAAFFPVMVYGDAALAHAPWEKLFYQSPVGILTSGNYAVHVFIAISAFVLLRKVYEGSTAIRLAEVARRYLRLMLPIAASSCIAILLLNQSDGAHTLAAHITRSPWLVGQWPASASFWMALREGVWDTLWVQASTYNSNLWMMHYIWYGSLAAFTIGAIIRWPWVRVLVYCIGLLLTWTTVFAAFWIGALLLHFSKRLLTLPDRFRGMNGVGVALLLVGVVLGSVPTLLGDMTNTYSSTVRTLLYTPNFSNVAHFLGAGCTLLAILLSPGLRSALQKPVLLALGRIGYASFLLHVLLISSLSSWLIIHFSSLPYHFAVGWTFLITTIVLVGSSILFQRFIEKPSERFSRYIASR